MLTLESLAVNFFSCYPKYFKGFKYRLQLCSKNCLKSKRILVPALEPPLQSHQGPGHRTGRLRSEALGQGGPEGPRQVLAAAAGQAVIGKLLLGFPNIFRVAGD